MPKQYNLQFIKLAVRRPGIPGLRIKQEAMTKDEDDKHEARSTD